jgi:hypothetical protein
MADPVDLLVPDIQAAIEDAGIDGVSVLDGPRSGSLTPPCVVIQPDQPWLVPSQFCYDEQRYQAIMVVQAASSGDGRRMLYRIGRAIRESLTEGWAWESTQAMVIKEAGGLQYLGAGMRLLYRNTEEEGS